MNGRDLTVVERIQSMSDEELGTELTGFGRAIAWPATPDLSVVVVARLQRPARRWPIFGRPVRRALVLALIALLVVAGIAGALGLGLPGIRIFFAPAPTPTPSLSPASPSASPSSSPSPGPTGGAALGLGLRVTLAEAQAAVDFPIVQPTLPRLAPPDEVWLEGSGEFGVVSFVWMASGTAAAPGTNVGMLLSEFRGSVDPGLFTKMLQPGTTLEQVVVGGRAGYWITGAPHEVVVRIPNGDARGDLVRLAGNVLLWTRGDLTLRLETLVGKEDALAIGSSVR